jgi:hypothetical protein
VVIYNNVNFKDIKRDKLLGYTSVIRSLTTATIIFYLELPLSRLRQLIYNLIKPLQLNNIFRLPSFIRDKLIVKISYYLIANAIKGVYLYGVERVFTKSNLFP